MHKSDLALKLLEEASMASSREEAFRLASEAVMADPANTDARIIFARLSDDFEEKEAILKDLDSELRVRYELGCLYLNEGMYKRAISCFENSLAIESSLYYLLNALAALEDEKITDLYSSLADSCDEKRFVRCSFPYMVYLYKCGAYEKAKEIYEKILLIEPSFSLLFKGEDGSEEAKRIMKNNAALINGTPSLIQWLINREENDHD